MGFLADLVEDVEAATSVQKWRRKRVATVSVLVLVVGYLFAASGHLGDSMKDLLSTRGLSLFKGVTVDMLVQEQDPYQFDDADYDPRQDKKHTHDDDELRALVSGKVSPCMGATTVILKLYRTDRPGETRPAEWTQEFATDTDCRWRAPAPFFISELGAYEVEAHVHRSWHDIGGTTEPLKRIHPTGVEKTGAFVEQPAKPQTGNKVGRVTVVYLAEPNFNRRVFERDLLELNKRMQSFEVEIADFPRPSCVKGETSLANDCFAALKAKKFGPGLIVGIVPNTLEDENTGELFSVIDATKRYEILSSDQRLIFNGRSSPSIYKYLLSLIVASGATVARDQTLPVFYHHGVTRGCIFDYDQDKIRLQIGVEMGYLCEEHRAAFRKAKMAPEALSDLTAGLPLAWLK